MIKRKDYIFGFTTAFLMLMMLSATPTTKSDPRDLYIIEEQKRILSDQKDCIRKIQNKQIEIAKELSKIRDMLKN
jgi:hypothetical protein